MSLKWGGFFDIGADCEIDPSSHSFHRVGYSVDINSTGFGFTKEIINPDPSGRIKKPFVTILTDLGKTLAKFMKNHRGVKYAEDQIHFGFNNQH